MLEQAGLRPEVVMDFDRPTPLKDGPDGLRNWARQFFWADLKCLHEKRRVRIFEEMEKALRDELWDGTQWVADYRRIPGDRFQISRRPPQGKRRAGVPDTLIMLEPPTGILYKSRQ